jgi:branched-chain amino acid transport system substrate-binding protein
MMLYADAIRRAGTTDRAALRAALAATRDFAGVTGRITIDKDRNATKSAVMMRVAAGRTEFVETVDAVKRVPRPPRQLKVECCEAHSAKIP